MTRFTIKAFIFAALVCLVFDSVSAVSNTADDDDDDSDSPTSTIKPSSGLTPPTATSIIGRVSGVMMDSVKQQATETLDGAGKATSALVRLQPTAKGPSDGGGGGGGGGGGAAMNRLQETKGRTVAAAKRVVDETMHKLQSTVDGIKRTISGDDQDDEGGDRRVSAAFENLLRAVGSEGKAAFAYASDVINETADRAKVAVERAQNQKLQRRQP